MVTYRITTSLHHISGLPADDVVNTHYFQTNEGAPVPATATLLNGHVAAAYNTVNAPGTTTPAVWLSPEISRVNLPTVRCYDADSPGSPLATDLWAGFAGAANPSPLPNEVAVCLSFRGDYGSVLEEAADDADADAAPERPRSRRRGRTFFGPLHIGALGAGTTPVPHANLINVLLGMGKKLGDPATAGLIAVNATWVVYSRASLPHLPGADRTTDITECWVDNEFDTQRRRGRKATARTTQVVTPGP